MKCFERDTILLFNKLLAYYGPQHWWPGETEFEVAVGAILTQNTSWENVEKAIALLKPYLDPETVFNMRHDQLANLIRPSGFFNIKAKRLKNFLIWFKEKGFSFDNIKNMDTYRLRNELLNIKGIGRETADSIILYAAGMPIFVIDAYTRRMFSRLGFDVPLDYDDIRECFERNLPRDSQIYNEYHALIVKHSKEYCRKKPLCTQCFLNDCCCKIHETDKG